ncbi:DUF6708 domain-containing protein [Halomonas binhaiensis]|uniref:DUF6708 domain-containing protein n=1 Tax=Halomonas binhaiensis TaxID=2562282 RepID=A0A5C1NES9_9GAMM|nr:DUF6708 domain-containing protein [Halomonas binhaiensis]QEM81716.1 hypothetical protein E4T21_09275 [Halomonas binhaiensis]
MFTGWYVPFKLNRPLESAERHAALPFHPQPGVIPDTYGSLIHFNSTYTDFIDRKDRLRGMVSTTAGLVGIIVAIIMGAFSIGLFMVDLLQGNDVLINMAFSILFLLMVIGFIWFTWSRQLKKDMFTYTHYPIRFNRKTRKVYVFRHNGPNGVLTVPWDEVFWHIGRGMQQKYLCDVRGHVMDGVRVKDTFAVGQYFDDGQIGRIQATWEFIRRYMEEGPETVAEHPLDRLIDKSVTPSWTNCYLWVGASMGPSFVALRYVLFPLFYPIVGLLTLGRWLTLNSCKDPVWPPEVEAECQVEPNDPNRWEEPSYLWEFANRPGVVERNEERMRQQSENLKG